MERNIRLWYQPSQSTQRDYLLLNEVNYLQVVYVNEHELARLESGEIELDDLIDEEELVIEEGYVEIA